MDNLEYLNFVHNLLDVSKKTELTIISALAMAEANDEDHIKVPAGAAAAIASILGIKAKLVGLLVEENETISENLELFVKKIQEAADE